jgi:hypothetical protein
MHSDGVIARSTAIVRDLSAAPFLLTRPNLLMRNSDPTRPGALWPYS